MKFVSAMGRPGGARNNVDPRFISLYSTFEIQFPATASLFHIYNSILSVHVKSLATEIHVSLLPFTLFIEKKILTSFTIKKIISDNSDGTKKTYFIISYAKTI